MLLAGGKVAPGNSIESLGVGDILLNGGTFEYEINSSLLSADLLYGDTDSSLTLINNPILTLIDLGSSTVPLGTRFMLIAYHGAWNNGIFAGHADDSKFFFSGNRWQINYDDTTPGSNFVAEATAFGPTSAYVTLEAVAVPEPSTLALGLASALGAALFAWRRRVK